MLRVVFCVKRICLGISVTFFNSICLYSITKKQNVETKETEGVLLT